ncbi:MAG: hypothetical protein IJC39_00600, partial [Firmicutes bacterium]|nr:hypothetical protein [Bacillota bacterium]
MDIAEILKIFALRAIIKKNFVLKGGLYEKKVTFAACIIFLAVAFIIAPGFMKQGNVYISEYSISEDG